MKIREWNEAYLTIFKKFESMYHSVVVKYGFSDAQYWILYILYTCDEKEVYTQNQIAEEIGSPKQTVNSAITKFVKDGYLTLIQRKGIRTGKSVQLTKDGITLCEKCILPLLEAEKRALEEIPKENHTLFLKLFEERYKSIHHEITDLLEESL